MVRQFKETQGPPGQGSKFGKPADGIDRRFHCNANAVINRIGGERMLIRLVNFSQGGCRIAGFIGLATDEIISLETKGCARQPCRVAWVMDNVAGCQFLSPLPPPVFDAFLALARSVDRS